MSAGKLDIEVMERLFLSRKKFERFAMLYVRNQTEVQDILMESYAYIWEHRDSLTLDGNIEAYMFNVIKHKCLDWLDHQSVRRSAESDMLTDAQWELEMSISTLRAFDPAWLYDADIQQSIKEAVRELPDTTRRVFMLSRVENKTYKEIAEELGVSVKTVEYHISRALRQLRERLGSFGFICLMLCLSGICVEVA